MDVLRSVIQPITHSLPGPIRDIGVGLIGEACYQAVVLDVDETNTECIKLGVSKGLGVAIVAASAVVKVPQIVNLVRSRSAAGVSFLSYLLETTAYLVSLAYNVRNGFPFSTYGETGFILVQNVAITLLVLHYSGRSAQAAVLAAALAGGAASLFSEAAVSTELLGYLQAGAGTLGVASKVPQIVAIWQEGGTGQLSAFSVSRLPRTCPLALPAPADRPGLQLPPRLALAHLHDAAGGRRQADPVRLRRRLRPERRPGNPDGLLLEHSGQEGYHEARHEARDQEACSQEAMRRTEHKREGTRKRGETGNGVGIPCSGLLSYLILPSAWFCFRFGILIRRCNADGLTEDRLLLLHFSIPALITRI